MSEANIRSRARYVRKLSKKKDNARIRKTERKKTRKRVKRYHKIKIYATKIVFKRKKYIYEKLYGIRAYLLYGYVMVK